MKLAVFGRHPVFSPGFNSTMSFFIAVGFADLGWDVTVIHPGPSNASARSVDELRQLTVLLQDYDPHGRVSWTEVADFFSGNTSYDVGIWQTYAPEDEVHFVDFRRRVGLITKNFPRFFDGSESDRRRLNNSLRKFDVMGLALQEDADHAMTLDLGAEALRKLGFIGRGSCPKLLSPDRKNARPTIFVDNPPKPVDGTGEAALRHVWRTLLVLKERIPDIQIKTFGGKHAPDYVQRRAAEPFWNFYTSILAPSWFYFTFNYSFTTHVKRRVDIRPDKWMFLGQYENQVMETHLSGGLVIAHASDLPEELVPRDLSKCLFTDFSDTDGISERILEACSSFSELSNAARDFALRNHDFRQMAKRWNALLEQQ